MSVARWMRDLSALADEVGGGEVTYTNGGHVRIKLRNGGIVVAPKTPSDGRTVANLRAQLRRAARG